MRNDEQRVATSRASLIARACLNSALLFVCAWPAASMAQNTLRRGDVEVHYSAVPSINLSPEIARRYAITRSASRALLSIVILRDGVGEQRSIQAAVTGTATAADGAVQNLAIRPVRDGDAISYLAEPRIADGSRLEFALSVTPTGDNEAIEVRFSQEFFAPR